jgi:hypothetical protein
MGCNFCATSAFFGGKGRFVNFYDTGKQLFDVMCKVEQRLNVRTFFMMDENFLLYKKRALELLGEMKKNGKAWSMYVFSSANALRTYDMRQLVELGVSWVWMGFESAQSGYRKLKNADTVALTRELQSHGIRVQGSTIVGMEHHTPENMREEIEHAVAHDADCHQFMLYTPIPGGGLLHILFNVLWIRQLGPAVEELYGPSRLVVIFTLSGAAGFVVSNSLGVPFTIGASGSIFGLLGAMVAYGRKRGGAFGAMVLREYGQWAVILFIFGFFMAGVNNFAHAGGFLGGFVSGLVLSLAERRAETGLDRLLAAACVGLTMLGFALSLWTALARG